LSKKNFSFIVLAIIVIFTGGYFLFFQNEEKSIASEEIKPKDLMINKADSITSNNLNNLIKKAMNEQYTGKVSNIKVTEVLNVENGTFVSFLLEEGNYYGVLYTTKKNEEYILNDISISKNNKNDQLNVMELLGDTKEVTKRKYRIISGITNDKMDSVHIFYQNGEYLIIKLDSKQKTFLNVSVGNTVLPIKISGKLNDKEIFSIKYAN
jgi:hypothetical protein